MSDNTALGKRKSNDDSINGDDEIPFKLVPDVCWHLVAEFAAPPDVYHLCLGSKLFFREVNTGGDTSRAKKTRAKPAAVAVAPTSPTIEHLLSCGFSRPFLADQTEDQLKALLVKHPKGGKSSRKVVKPASRKSDSSPRLGGSSSVLATSLLRSSLLVSFGRVLKHSQSGITLEAAMTMGDLPDGSAVIAGSSVVQACLGVVWEGTYSQPLDVDVFCSAKAAPQVRSWLVEKAKCMFIGFKDYGMGGPEDATLTYTVDTKIHHVEHWGPIVNNYLADQAESYCSKDAFTGAIEEKMKAGVDFEEIKSSNYYKESTAYGKNCQKNYVDWKWQHGMHFTLLGLDPKNKAYQIKPKPRGELPFDFNGEGNTDLVVSKVGKNAYDLLDDFDLTICKASFNGKHFKIPSPHQTFAGKSTYDPTRRAIINSYMNHYQNPSTDEVYDKCMNASAIIQKVCKDVPRAPFYRYVDMAKELPDRYNPNAEPWDFEGGTFYDPKVQVKYAAPAQFHNWTCILAKRLEKYQKRGIEVIDPPTVKEGIRGFSLTSWGG